MTAAEIAQHLGARQTGAGRWIARCPLRPDRTPSLTIAEGEGGRILLHDFGGGDTAAILAALGLTWRDICGAPTSPAERERLGREREKRQAAEAAQRQHAEALAATGEGLHTRAGRIAGRMAALEFAGAAPAYPGEAEALAGEYHAALHAEREMEVADVA